MSFEKTWQEEQLGAGIADQLSDGVAFVAAQIVHDDDVSAAQGGDEELLDVSPETDAVDRPVDNAGRLDPIATQGGQECQGAPAALRHLGDQARAAASRP